MQPPKLVIVCLCLMRTRRGGFPAQDIADLHFLEYLDCSACGGAGWLTSWNSTTAPRISPETLQVSDLITTRGSLREPCPSPKNEEGIPNYFEITPQAIRSPAFPDGSLFRSSAFA